MAMDRLLVLPEVLAVTHLTKSPLYRLIAAGDFPKPLRIGTVARWSELEVQEWIGQKRNAPRDTSTTIKVVHDNNNAA